MGFHTRLVIMHEGTRKSYEHRLHEPGIIFLWCKFPQQDKISSIALWEKLWLSVGSESTFCFTEDKLLFEAAFCGPSAILLYTQQPNRLPCPVDAGTDEAGPKHKHKNLCSTVHSSANISSSLNKFTVISSTTGRALQLSSSPVCHHLKEALRFLIHISLQIWHSPATGFQYSHPYRPQSKQYQISS